MADPVFSIDIQFSGDRNLWRTGTRGALRKESTIMNSLRKGMMKEAEFLRTKVVEGIRDQAPGGQSFKPLSPFTIAMRAFLRVRSTKALIERGDLLRSVKVHKISDEQVFVGVKRGTLGSDGRDLVNIGMINEFGSKKPVVIRMTPKMRAFLGAFFRKMRIPYKPGHGDGTIRFVIPPRPFFGPVGKKYGPSSGERVKKRMLENLPALLKDMKAGG